MSLSSPMSVAAKPLLRIINVSTKAVATIAALPTISTNFLPMEFFNRVELSDHYLTPPQLAALILRRVDPRRWRA